MDRQRTLRQYFQGAPSENERLVEGIIKKLKCNGDLNRQERTYLLEYIKNYTESSGAKRKAVEDINVPRPKMVNKKVQVRIAQGSKDYFAQTDSICPAILRHIARKEVILKQIKEFATNKKGSKEEIRRLMRRSFVDRRRWILFDYASVAEVKKTYPLLFSADEVKNELNRIFYGDKCSEFLTNIVKYSSYILAKCDQSDEVFIRSMERQMKARTREEEQYALAVGSVLTLPKLMHEALGFVDLPNNPSESDDYPCIKGSMHFMEDVFSDIHPFEIRAEGTLLCKASNFIEAVLCLMASYFIFNFEYKKNCPKTLILFEKVYLNVEGTCEEYIDGRTKQFIQNLKCSDGV